MNLVYKYNKGGVPGEMFEDNYGGLEYENALLHTKSWDFYMN